METSNPTYVGIVNFISEKTNYEVTNLMRNFFDAQWGDMKIKFGDFSQKTKAQPKKPLPVPVSVEVLES